MEEPSRSASEDGDDLSEGEEDSASEIVRKQATTTWRLCIPVTEVHEINFQKLIKQQQGESLEEPKVLEEEEEGEEEGDEEGDEEQQYMDSSNRLTSIISNIERMNRKSEDLGYDKEDSFIDDTDLLSPPKKKVKTKYGGFFVHRGALQSVPTKRKAEEKDKHKAKKPKEEKKRDKKEKSVKEKAKEKGDPKDKPKEESKAKEAKKEPKDGKVKKPTDSAAVTSLPPEVEEMISKFEEEWKKREMSKGKNKRFPPDLEGAFYRICKEARGKVGSWSTALSDRLQFMGLATSALKGRFTKLNGLEGRVKALQESFQGNVDKLKAKISERSATGDFSNFINQELEEILYSVVTDKHSLIKNQNTKRRLEDSNLPEISLASETTELLKKLASMFPQECGLEEQKLNALFQATKKAKQQEDKKGKQPPAESKTTEKKAAFTERRKKKGPTSGVPAGMMVKMDLNEPMT